jgi:hypothetical protein
LCIDLPHFAEAVVAVPRSEPNNSEVEIGIVEERDITAVSQWVGIESGVERSSEATKGLEPGLVGIAVYDLEGLLRGPIPSNT